MRCRNLLGQKKQRCTERNEVRRETDNNNSEDSPRVEQNISNQNKITQSDERRKSLTQNKTSFACNSTDHEIKKCTKKRNILVKHKERG